MRIRIRDPKSFWPWIRDSGSGMEKFGSGVRGPGKTAQIRKTGNKSCINTVPESLVRNGDDLYLTSTASFF